MNRFDIIQKLINKYNYKSYLEIGVEGGECFNKIICEFKHSVDPAGNSTFIMTSDVFFATNKNKYDIIFIDGLHTREQVMRDILNSLKCLSLNGIIVVHDCLPATEREQSAIPLHGEPWTGDVWKAIASLVKFNSSLLNINVVNTDHGCGIIQSKSRLSQFYEDIVNPEYNFSYKQYQIEKNELLNIISIEQFEKVYLS